MSGVRRGHRIGLGAVLLPSYSCLTLPCALTPSPSSHLGAVLLLLPLRGTGKAMVVEHLARNHPVTLGVGGIL